MTKPELDEATRFFLAAMLPKFPEALTRLMLADGQKLPVLPPEAFNLRREAARSAPPSTLTR